MRIRKTSLLLCLTVSNVTWAQDEPTLEVVVVGEPLEAPPSDESAPVRVLDEDALDDEASGRIERSLREVAGVQQFRSSDARTAHPTSQGLTLRGLGGNAASRVLVLVDGVPQADPFGGWISWPGYDSLPLQRITVRRGASSGVYGPGALAGTIELETKSASDVPRVGGSVFHGSRDSVALRGALSGPLGPVRATAAGSYETGDGYVPVAPPGRGPVDQPANYEQAGVSLRTVVPTTETSELQVLGRLFTDSRNRGFAFTDNENEGADLGLRYVAGRPHEFQWSALAYVQARELRSSFGAVDAERSSVQQVLDQHRVPSTGMGARLAFNPHVDDDLSWRFGVDFRGQEGHTEERFLFEGGIPQRERTAGGRSDTVGLFQDLSYRASKRLTVSAGGRVDFWRLSGGFSRVTETGGASLSDERPKGRTGVEGTGRIGASYRPTEKWNFRSAAYTGWRLPTLNELYRPFRVGADATAANPELAPERIVGAEAGVGYGGIPGLDIEVTLFQNRLEDAVFNVTLDRGPGMFPGVGFVSNAGVYRQRNNVDALHSQGIESFVALDGARVLALPGTRAIVSYSHVDAVILSSGVASPLTGRRPAQVPSDILSGTLSWTSADEGVELASTVRYMARRFEDDDEELQLDGAVTLDAVARVDVSHGFALVGRAENLTDERVDASLRDGGSLVELAQPRTFWLGLSWHRQAAQTEPTRTDAMQPPASTRETNER